MQVNLRRRGLQSFNPAEFANSEEHLQLLLQVQQLDLSFNSLYTIRGLEGLTHLTVLNISNNGLRSLGSGLPLTLRELDASHNSLSTLQNAALLPLQSLTSLNVSFNDLEDLRGVPNVTAQLAYLDVRSNRLISLQGIEHCAQLQTLHAEANLLREVADVASLKCLPKLRGVFLAGNPILLRKRMLHGLRLLFPPSVEQDDIPTTAPPSSVRSSTAPPPSVPGTSSMCSLENSALMSYTDDHETGMEEEGPAVGDAALHDTSQRSSRPASVHQSGLPLAAPSSHHHFMQRKDSPRNATVAALSTNPSRSSAPDIVVSLHPLARASTTRHESSLLSSKTFATAAAASTTSVAATTTRSRGVVVGSDSDSPSCPRRSLPHEHRLGDSPASASSISPERTVGVRPSPSAMPPAAVDAAAVRATPGPGSPSSSRLLTTSHTVTTTAAPVTWKQDRPFASTERTRSSAHPRGLSREELEEQLVRVMAERDTYRREIDALRKEVAHLKQLLTTRNGRGKGNDEILAGATTSTQDGQQHLSDLIPSAFSDVHSADLNSTPSTIPSGTAQSIDASQLKDVISPYPRQRQQGSIATATAAATSHPSSRVLAVEMSGQSSSANSETGDRKRSASVDAPKQMNHLNRVSSGSSSAKAELAAIVTSPSSSINQQRKAGPVNTSDRRVIAALFMSKLQKSSAK